MDRIGPLEAGESNPRAEIELLRPDGATVVAESTSIAIRLHDGPAVPIILGAAHTEVVRYSSRVCSQGQRWCNWDA